MKKITQELSTGTLDIQINKGDWQPKDLFCLAERRNPKRAFLFVSKVLGKHIPVSPAIMRKTYQALAAKIRITHTEPVLFIGMAETAVGLAAGVYEEVSKQIANKTLFLSTTRHPIAAPCLATFQEEHSHATTHHLYYQAQPNALPLSAYKTLVLIDDESTTGNTFINLLNALFAHTEITRAVLDNIIVVTLTDWSEQRIDSINKTGVPIQKVSLMTGCWQWQPKAHPPTITMPDVSATSSGNALISARQDFGRGGMHRYQAEDWLNKYQLDSDATEQRILVLGTGEFLYPAFLLAERLEQQGAFVEFGSTTRSPIALGLGIQSVLSFSDNYGQGIVNFCYNLQPEKYDRIILCTETPAQYIDAQFIADLQHIASIVDVAYYE